MSKSETKKLRNPEGEAQAQWREQDLDFGGKKKQMVGSDGQIILLEDEAQSDDKQANLLKATMSGTEQKEERYFMNLLTTDYTVYKFEVAFGANSKWGIRKRYSDFDRLDNRVNCSLKVPFLVRFHRNKRT
jgi:hypothetical protein